MKTSPVGDGRRRGFTLLELLTVLAIMGVLTAMALPVYQTVAPRFRLAAAARQVVGDLRGARREAITEKAIVPVAFDPRQPAYIIDHHRHALSTKLTVSSGDGPGWPDGSDPVARFYADGSADPVVIVLSDGEKQKTIRVSWLTGQVKLVE